MQVGANANTTIDVDLSVSFTMKSMQDHLGGVVDGNGYDAANETFDISTMDKAQNVLGSIDTYIAYFDSKRAELGALSNRLESTIRNQEQGIENHSDTRSRIQDADYAQESANLVSANIMQNATASMMTQANAFPNVVANLLS